MNKDDLIPFSWENAPDWAVCYAYDGDGQKFWYSGTIEWWGVLDGWAASKDVDVPELWLRPDHSAPPCPTEPENSLVMRSSEHVE